MSRSESEPEPEPQHHHHTGTMNTLSSGGGENVYSRINETGEWNLFYIFKVYAYILYSIFLCIFVIASS